MLTTPFELIRMKNPQNKTINFRISETGYFVVLIYICPVHFTIEVMFLAFETDKLKYVHKV